MNGSAPADRSGAGPVITFTSSQSGNFVTLNEVTFSG
jgi:hypothetical protein